MSYGPVHTLPLGGGGGGGGGSSTPAAITTYVQRFATPQTTWSVTHPLGTATPVVFLYDLSGYEIGGDVHAIDTSTVVINFAMPVSGNVVLKG